MTELYLSYPLKYIREALHEGFNNFTFHVAGSVKSNTEVLSLVRTASMGYGRELKILMIDYAGAAEYTQFSTYDKPNAVYPTWAAEDEPWSQLLHLMENNPGDSYDFCTDPGIQREWRPVFGQKHKVVIHRPGAHSIARDSMIWDLAELQRQYPHVEIIVSGLLSFAHLFDYGFAGVDSLPINVTMSGLVTQAVRLPSGKVLQGREKIMDPRYADWFELLGYNQVLISSNNDMLRYNLSALKWAWKNWTSVKPFIAVRKKMTPDTMFRRVGPDAFVLPAARRRLMRNLKLKTIEGMDKFLCDTCILQNVCSLYREDSVCTLRGSDTVGLAESFNTRSATGIIAGLSKLLDRQIERLDDAQAAEEAAGEVDPEVTKMYKTVFDQGVKLAKLHDPSLTGGPSVQVNVGIGGQASVAASDPRQLMAGLVAELEAAGIPREQITSDMIKGVLESAAKNGMKHAIESTKAIEGKVV